MRFILLVFAFVQFSCVEPRCVMMPSCQCKVNYITPAPQVHRVESCPNSALPLSDDGYSRRATAVPYYNEVHASRTLHSKAYPQHIPEFHDEISYQRNYYPGSIEEDFEIESIIYEDDNHEVRHRRSVLPEDEHHHHHVHEDHHHHDEVHHDHDDYRKYIEDWEGEESETVEVEDDEYGEIELNSDVDATNEGREAISEIFTQSRKQKGDLELGNVVSEADVESIEKEKYKMVTSEQEQNTEVMEQGSDGIPSEKDEKSKIGKKTRRSISDQQYKPSNQGYCSVLDRYSKSGDHTHSNNVHADDCTISKNLFFGCGMELEDESLKETQRKARKVPKTLTQKMIELKMKNDKLKNKAKLAKSKANLKSKKVNKLDKLENSLKKDGPLRNKRKDEEERVQRELGDVEKTCPCGFDRNGFCQCQFQPYHPPHPAPMYYENSRGPMVYPVRRVYRQYVPQMPFNGYYRR